MMSSAPNEALHPQSAAPSSAAQISSPEVRLREAGLAHVLFLDIVGFSKLFLAQQVKVLRQLEQVVRETEAFSLKAEDRLIIRSTGDGMALVFFTPNAVQAVECAEQIDKALRSKGYEFGLRTGLHTGPVFRITDINEEKNVAGGGINTAQRVMDCGDAGHILLSDKVADQLDGSPTWQAKLHDIGSVKVKHDQQVHLHNLHGDGVGNSAMPKKLQLELDKDALKNEYASKLRQQRTEKKLFGLAALFFLALAIGVVIYSTRTADLLRRGEYSVAVIQVPNSSGNPEVNEHIGEVTDSLRVYLTANDDSNLTILPAEASKAYKGVDPFQAGKALKAQAVFTVEGKESGSDYLITVWFHDVANNITCCEQEYVINENNRPQKFSEMEHDAMATIRLKHIPGEKRPASLSLNAKANEAYSDAIYFWKRRKSGQPGKPGDLEVALQKFQQATKYDQNFVLAYIGLADCYTSIGGLTMSAKEAKAEALKAIEAAEELLKVKPNLDLPELHAAKGLIYYWLARNWKDADKEFNEAIKLDRRLYAPHARYGAFLVAVQRPFEALAQIIQAQAINPYSWPLNTSLGQFYYFTGQTELALEQYKSILDKTPEADPARRFEALAFEQNGNYTEAINDLKKIAETSYEYPDALAALGHIYAINKDKVKAYEVLRQLDALKSGGRYVSSYSIAVIHLGLGDTTQAFKLFNQAVEENDVRLAWLNVDPRLKNLRETKSKHDHDEFAKLLQAAFPPQPN